MRRMPQGWTPEMDAALLRVFPTSGADAVSKLVGRSYSSVQMRAYRLGIQMHRRGKRPGGGALTDRLATAIIDSGAAGLSTAEFCARNPDDNVLSVRTTVGRLREEGRAFHVGHQALRRWFCTRDLAEAYRLAGLPPTYRQRLVAERAARKAQRTLERVAREAKKAAAAERKWTDSENRYLRKHYPTQGAKFVAPVLGRSVTAVTAQAAVLSVRCEVCVQLIGYVKKAPVPKLVPKPRPVVVAPALPKAAPKPRGPALSDGPVLYHPNFKFTRAPAPPAALRTNTYSTY